MQQIYHSAKGSPSHHSLLNILCIRKLRIFAQPAGISFHLLRRIMALLQSALFLSILLSLSLFSPLIQASDINYCDNKANYDVKVNGVEISPYPVSRGVDTIFSISASTGQAISEGRLTIEVSYFGFHIYSEIDNICDKTSCPVATGDFVVSHSQVLPIFTPPGTYSLTMKMVDGNNRQLTCIHFDFSIGFGATETSLADDM